MTRLASVLCSSPVAPGWRLEVWNDPPLEKEVSLRLAELELVEFIPRLDSETEIILRLAKTAWTL